MPSNVPNPSFGPTGFIAPSEEQIIEGVFLDMNAAFNGNLNTALDTPQGQLATSLAAIVGNKDDLFVYFTNQTDPNFAVGRMQDAIGRISFLSRKGAEATVVQAVCSGLPNLIIPPGALARAEDGNIYTCIDGGAIGLGGTVTLAFACNVLGPVACQAGSLDQIYQAIPGWDSILNLVDGVLGNNTESQREFETRRQASVALNSRGSLNAIKGAVLNVTGVLDAYAIENPLASPTTIGPVTLVAHSIYVAAVGGTDLDVATAIITKKAPGADYNGNTTVVVTDDNSGYSPPLPTYSVKFQRPTELAILFAVNIANSAQVPSNAASLIQNAIIAAFAGNDGGPRATIGSTQYASRYISPVAALGAWVQIISLLVGSRNTPAATFTASIAGTLMTVTVASTGTIAVGQYVSDATNGVLSGTKITSLGTGAGGIGTYNLNLTQTVTSRAMVGAVAGSGSQVVNIDQVPTIQAGNIAVTLT